MIHSKFVTFELSERIHDTALEKGVTLKNSEYHWYREDGKSDWFLEQTYNNPSPLRKIKTSVYYSCIPAYDVQELGEILHDQISETHPCNAGWEVQRPKDPLGHPPEYEYVSAKTEVEARGKMLLHILENHKL